ncbi:MAG: hypothetical protein P1U90_22410 [Akkermansiaceae bacterium]|nr:hypothetical protein [Akkermansiaceae bacterium]
MKNLFVILTMCLLVAELLSLFWFKNPGTHFASLKANDGVRRASLIGERSSDLLGFDRGTNYFSDRGGDVLVTVLTWNAANSHGLMDAFGHSPEVCLPVSGAKLLTTFPVRELEIGGRIFEVRRWMFSHPLYDKKIHAFKLAHSSHRKLVEMALKKELVKGRLLLFKKRSKLPFIEIAIGVVHGTNNADLAWERFARFAHQNFQLTQAAP